MEKEPLPIISAPGAVIALFVWLGIANVNGIIPPINDSGIYLSLGAIALAAGPIYGTIFHAIWKLFWGYGTFGYQRDFLVDERLDRKDVYEKFDEAIFTCDPKKFSTGLHDMIRRRTSGYLHNLYFQYATYCGYAVYFLIIAKHLKTINLLIPAITLVIIMVLSLMLWYLRKSISSNQRSNEIDLIKQNGNEDFIKSLRLENKAKEPNARQK